MNETRLALLCLKMSPVPTKENRSPDWLLWKGRGWGERLSSPPGPWEDCSAFSSDLVQIWGFNPIFLPVHRANSVHKEERGYPPEDRTLHVLCEKKPRSPALARYTPSQCPGLSLGLVSELCTIHNLSLNIHAELSTNYQGL